jgi:hypothetical protein
MNCTFCRILNNKLASSRLYEDEYMVAFLDIRPIAPGHTLSFRGGMATALGGRFPQAIVLKRFPATNWIP